MEVDRKDLNRMVDIGFGSCQMFEVGLKLHCQYKDLVRKEVEGSGSNGKY